MDSGVAGVVMPEDMVARVKIERKTAPKRFVAANGEHMRDLGETDALHSDVRAWSNVSSQSSESSELETLRCWINKRVRTIEILEMDTVSKLDKNSGVYTVDMWICLDDTIPVFSWQGQ